MKPRPIWLDTTITITTFILPYQWHCVNSYLNHTTWKNDPAPPCLGPHHRSASCRVPPEEEWALVTGHIIPGCWQGERGQPCCQGREGTEEVTGVGGGGVRRNGGPFIEPFLEWQAAQLWHWWCIPAHVGLSPHRQGWKEDHRNVVEGRPSWTLFTHHFNCRIGFYQLVNWILMT